MDFTVQVFDSLYRGRGQIDEFDVNASIEDVRWQTTANGYGGFECGMVLGETAPLVGRLRKLRALAFHNHLEIYQGNRHIYEGRIKRVSYGRGGLANGFVAEGYMAMLNDQWNRLTSTTSGTSGDLFEQLLNTYLPHLRIGTSAQFIDPGVSHAGGVNEWRRLTLGQIAQQIISEGNSDGVPVDIAIWNERRVWCLPRQLPAGGAEYLVTFDPETMTWEEDCEPMASHVTVEYGTGASGTLTAEDDTDGFLDNNGFEAARLVSVGNLTATSATALRARELAIRSQPEIAATINLTGGTGLTLRSGMEQPQSFIRALGWVEYDNERNLQIVGTSHDASAESLQIQLGSLSPYLPENLFVEVRDVTNAVRKFLSPNGGRMR